MNHIVSAAGHTISLCRHFPICGGCALQDMQADAYTARKRDAVLEMLAANGLEAANISGPHVSPRMSRRRANFAVVQPGKNVTIGFNRARSHEVIDMQECHILRPEITALLPELRQRLRDYPGVGKGFHAHITYLSGALDLVIIGGAEPGLREREILAAMAEEMNIARVSWRKWDRSPIEPIAHRAPVMAHFKHGMAEFPPGGFLQATAEGETALTETVAAALGDAAPVADLFCGLGTFALSLPPRAVTAIDSDGNAIQTLQHATRANGHFTALARDLSREPLSAAELNKFKAVILDPPRDGAKKQAQELAASKVPLIAYVGCDLKSFGRDGKILQGGGYRLEGLTIIDQFLWSAHIEVVGVFRK